MKRQDWIDYFEAVHGRTPNEQEYAQALAAGEFVEDVSTEVETPAEPIQEHYSSTQQVPPQQGIQHTQYQGQQSVRPTYQETSARFFKQFWQWLLSAWKSPTSIVSTHKYNGYFAFFLLTLLASFNVFIPLSQAAAEANSAINNFNNNYYNTGYNGVTVGFGVFFRIFFVVAFLFFGLILASFVARKIVYKDSRTLSDYFEWYGRLFSVNTLLFAVSAFFLLLMTYVMAGVVLFFNFFLLSSILAFSMANFEKVRSLDKIYQYIIAMLLNSIVLFLAYLIVGGIAGEMIYRLESIFNF